YSLARENLSLGATPKVAKFKVGGVFETGMFEYDSALGYILLSEAQKLFNLGNSVSGLEVRIDNFYQAQEVAKELERIIGPKFIAVDWMRMHKNLFSWMSLEKYAMFLALSLIVAVAAFNIISTLIMIVLEKKKEIGILKSLGATSQSIMKIFMFKGLAVGLVGTVLGIGAGFILCWLQKTFDVISLPSEIYFISSLPVDMRVLDFILVGVASVGIAFLATIYPAKKAAGLNPVEAIRFE
ncbi:MAG: FtsX-like permease family protein, partial [candidate division Zixibacteria bacterium]|nr:FtsX-like permease family protein [candidate division Zixibacteria bacterium]